MGVSGLHVECLNEYAIPVRMTVMSRLLNTHKLL